MPRERLAAIEARAAATVEFPGEATVQVRVVNTYEVVARDVPALVAFARAVLDRADYMVEGHWLHELADEHLGGES